MEDKTRNNPAYQEAVSEATDMLKIEVEEMIRQGATPEEIYLSLRAMSDDLTNHPNYKQTVTCGKTDGDCSFCCHESILLGKMETQYIIKVVQEKKIKPNMERVREQMTNPDIKWAQKACPLLLEPNEHGKRLCSIYEERPLICRTHNSNEDPKNCDRSTDPAKYVAETRASLIDAIQMVAVMVGLDVRKPYSSVHETMFYMFANGEEKMDIIKQEQLMCTICKKPHGLTDEDAGSSREMMRVCVSCLENVRNRKHL